MKTRLCLSTYSGRVKGYQKISRTPLRLFLTILNICPHPTRHIVVQKMILRGKNSKKVNLVKKNDNTEKIFLDDYRSKLQA